MSRPRCLGHAKVGLSARRVAGSTPANVRKSVIRKSLPGFCRVSHPGRLLHQVARGVGLEEADDDLAGDPAADRAEVKGAGVLPDV
jgi:hypothetical protein